MALVGEGAAAAGDQGLWDSGLRAAAGLPARVNDGRSRGSFIPRDSHRLDGSAFLPAVYRRGAAISARRGVCWEGPGGLES